MKKFKFSLIFNFICLLGLIVWPLLINAAQNLEQDSDVDKAFLALNQNTTAIEFVEPIKEGWIISAFGLRTNPFTGNKEFNKGLDIAAPKGTEVYAAADGTVVSAVSDYEPENYYGKYILIMHSNKIKSHYSKLDSVLVKKGQTVKAGELIGKVGSTGRSRGPHLHFEIYVDDDAQNPIEYIDFKSEPIIKSYFIPKAVHIETRLN
jgi:murein DD-endopeptidase MepM/ murein hydrolase activator NlpD